MRKLSLLLLTSLCFAEPDGAIADPARWTGPNGPASQSRRSRALPVTGDVVSAWTVELPGKPVAPPVTWDGTAYLLCAARKGHELVAVDVATGALLASKVLSAAPAAPIHVWGSRVYVFTGRNQVSSFRRVRGTFVEKWKYVHKTPGAAEFRFHSMTVFEHEVYVVSGDGLIRASPGLRAPVWDEIGYVHGPPAIYGGSVLVVEMGKAGGVRMPHLVSRDRRTGAETSKTPLPWAHGAGPPTPSRVATLVAWPGRVLAGAPRDHRATRKGAIHGLVSCELRDGLVKLLQIEGGVELSITPAVYGNGLLSCEGKSEWQWWRGVLGRVLATRRESADLFRTVVPPTVLGNVVYFGTWAADPETGEILWRLPLASVDFGVVPADRLFLVASADRLHAFRSRVG